MVSSFTRWFFGRFRRPDLTVQALNAIEAERAALAADLPFERVETSSEKALETWQSLRRENRGWPIIVGDDEDLGRLAETRSLESDTPEAILAAAEAMSFPEGLDAFRKKQHEQAMAWLAEHGDTVDKTIEAPRDIEGEWPEVPPPETGLTVALDYRGKALKKVHILLIPTARGADVPAFLRWGGWNECPLPQHHVAALRAWETAYGAELIGMSADVLNVRVRRRPASRDEALALAHTQYRYCADIVEQGVGAVKPLAAGLMASDWWYFWWD